MEQDGDERGGGGEEQPHVPAHHHPQRLQDLAEDVFFHYCKSKVLKSSQVFVPPRQKTALTKLG